MANATDYLKWRGDLAFSAAPLNEVDAFLLSQLSTMNFEGIVPETTESLLLEEAAQRYFQREGNDDRIPGMLQAKMVVPMFRLLSTTERFRKARFTCLSNRNCEEEEEQFSAVTILLPDGMVCVSYRGTDDSIIGWKEDFNLATQEEVPAQRDALVYLEKVAKAFPEGEILVCGHSKGGNLAVYASSMAGDEIQRRICGVYNFDGPGFLHTFLEKNGYRSICGKVVTVLSQNSMIGTLLNPVGIRRVVQSIVQGPLAHDGFNWEVLGTKFIRCDALSESSQRFDTAISATIESMTSGERQEFVNELFDTLQSTGAKTVTDLFNQKLGQTVEMIWKLTQQNKRVSSFTARFIEEMIKSMKLPEFDFKWPEIDLKLPDFGLKTAETPETGREETR